MKMFTKIAVIVLVFLVGFQVVSAAYGQVFGGKKIINIKAIEIQTYEAADFVCPVVGSTIEIFSIKGPTSYFIPPTITSRTRITPNIGQKIMGFYTGQGKIPIGLELQDKQTTVAGTEIIVCTHPSGPVVNVALPRIILFGNSRI